jgi:predicted Zn-dependent protease
MVPRAFPYGRHLVCLLMAMTGSAAAVPPPDPGSDWADSRLETLCEYGIALALGGEAARAESVFLSLLSEAPGDPRALNNLGNVALLEGDAGAAYHFYLRASTSDSTDPGILLNQATALMLLGERDGALRTAQSGVSRAGGLDRAADLLGLAFEEQGPEGSRGGKKPLNREEALLLLERAAAKVPADSVRVETPVDQPDKPPSHSWRLAGPRAVDSADSTAAVYWKR